MASASDDNTIIIWRLGVEDCEGILNGHKGPVYHVLFSSNTKKCISGSQDSTIIIWELANEKPLFTLIGHEEAVSCLALDSFDNILVSGSVDKTVKVWNIETQTLEFSFSGHLDKVTCITMSFDNNYAISGSQDKTIRVWDIFNYKIWENFGQHDDEVTSLSFKTSKVDIMTSRSNVGTLRSNYFIDNKNLELFADEEGFSDKIISSSLDKTVKIWKFPDFEIEYILPCVKEVFKLSVTSDFSYMFMQTEKKFIKMWSIPDKQALLTLYEYPEIDVLALSPNKEWLVFNSKNKIISVKSPLSRESENTVLPYSYSYLFKVLVYRILNNDKSQKKTIFSNYFFCPSNISFLHILTFTSHSKLLTSSINNGAKFFRTKWGETPLSIALARKSKICAEVLIKVFTKSKFSEHPYIFEYLEGLLPILNKSSLPSLHILYKAAFPKIESQNLPTFGTFIGNPPVVRMSNTKNIDPKLFLQNRSNDIDNLTDRELEFRRSQITLDLTPGSSQCIKFIQSLLKCKNNEIFKTDFVKSVLKYKWRQIKWVLFLQASLYLILLMTVILNTVVSRHNRTLLSIEVIINTIFLAYELSQACSGVLAYLNDIWNLCDATRIVLLYFYVFFTLGQANQMAQDVFLVLIQIVMWTRLVGYFRIFDRTRYLIHLLLKVMTDLGPFLIIFFLSNFAATLAFYSNSSDSDFGDLLLATYSISYGAWDYTWPTELQYIIFILCSLINTLVLLNLLIAIISDTYSRVSENLEIVDMQELADIISEVDTIIYWNRNKAKKQYLMSCSVAGSNKHSKSDNVNKILSTRISEIDQKFKLNEKSLEKIRISATKIFNKDLTDKNKVIIELIWGIKNEFSSFKNEMEAEIRQVKHDISTVKNVLKD